MFAETRPQAIEDMRQAADELRARAGGGDGHVRRQPQHQHLQRLHRRLRLLRLRSGQALPRRLRARPAGVRRAHPRGARLRRHRAVHPVGDPSRLGPRGLPRLAAPGQADRRRGRRRAAPARLQPDGDRPHVRHLRPARLGGVRAAEGRRARLHAGHRRGGPARRGARAHLPEQAARGALGGDHPGQPRRRAALDRHRHVRAHRGALGAGRAHAGGAGAAGAHGRDHRVRAAVLHPLPDPAWADPRRPGDLPRGEPQAHRRLPAGARAHDRKPAGQLGEDGPGRRHRVAVAGASTTSAAR